MFSFLTPVVKVVLDSRESSYALNVSTKILTKGNISTKTMQWQI